MAFLSAFFTTIASVFFLAGCFCVLIIAGIVLILAGRQIAKLKGNRILKVVCYLLGVISLLSGGISFSANLYMIVQYLI